MKYCDVCGRQAVTAEFCVVDGREVEVFLCEKCLASAERNGISTAQLVTILKSSQGKFCPVCGTTEKAFLETFRFGCSSCYEYMRELALLATEKVQNSTMHKGKAPRR